MRVKREKKGGVTSKNYPENRNCISRMLRIKYFHQIRLLKYLSLSMHFGPNVSRLEAPESRVWLPLLFTEVNHEEKLHESRTHNSVLESLSLSLT